MSYKIEIQNNFFVVTDTATGIEEIREVRDQVKWRVSGSIYSFFYNIANLVDQNSPNIIRLGENAKEFDFSEIVDSTETPFASRAIFNDLLNVNLGFMIRETSSVWGLITGDINDQTDLQTILNGKFDVPTGDTTQYIAGDGTLITFPVAGQAGTLVREVRNTTGATLTKGTVVYINGANGNKPTVAKAQANAESTSARTFGLLQSNIANNSNGFVVVIGDLIGLNTSAITEGTQLYLSSTVAGEYTTTKQVAPAHMVYVGKVTRSHPTLGQIEVYIQNGFELDELHDVLISGETDGQVLQFEGASGLWKNKTLATGLTVGSTAISSGTDGRVLFQNGGVLQQSANFFWDNTNSRLGIGTSSPTATLEVNGEILTKTSNPLFTLRDSDNDINAMYLGADFNFSAGTISYTTLSVNRNPANGVFFNTARAGAQINLESSNNNGTIGFYTSNLNNTTPNLSMVINQLGYVGIGQTPPTARLDIKAQGALSTDIAFRVRNSANTADWFSVQGNNITNVVRLTSSESITIAQPAGFYYPTLGFSNNGGASQGSIYGYNSRLVLSSSRIAVGSVFSINFGNFDANYAQLEVKAKDALSTSNSFGVLDSALSMYFFKVQNNGSIGIGTTAAIVASAKVQIDSTTQGFLPPRMTNAQRTAIASPAVGLMVYCTDATEGLYVYKSTGWTFVI
jgi:hypothetical protein